ncbi:hypothetical protein HYN56_16245 [Flavobacterium crocinum]|uniref:Uncharacterized protein n=1 Tax=Flavobacterium crocinum TaxID=2183896 RepID=A0A2S1YNT9_9FLAO|nr:hypothetical protein HYN56_16245 [Flavobacterium crocinum]
MFFSSLLSNIAFGFNHRDTMEKDTFPVVETTGYVYADCVNEIFKLAKEIMFRTKKNSQI